MHRILMYIRHMVDPKLLRGSLDTIILKLLSEHQEMYGYQITQMVKEITKGEIQLTEGALYPALHRLEGKGILSTTIRKMNNRMRKYYSLTQDGHSEVDQRLSAMQALIDNLGLLLKPKMT